MSLKIIESCVNCFACEPVCPSKAIYETTPHFLIDPKKCTECVGDFDVPQCASICPIEGAILCTWCSNQSARFINGHSPRKNGGGNG